MLTSNETSAPVFRPPDSSLSTAIRHDPHIRHNPAKSHSLCGIMHNLCPFFDFVKVCHPFLIQPLLSGNGFHVNFLFDNPQT